MRAVLQPALKSDEEAIETILEAVKKPVISREATL